MSHSAGTWLAIKGALVLPITPVLPSEGIAVTNDWAAPHTIPLEENQIEVDGEKGKVGMSIALDLLNEPDL